ncbi:biotin--[acetyl-CoA-carboxylase] ligase, partial [Thermithiobacillus plumbiphilus]
SAMPSHLQQAILQSLSQQPHAGTQLARCLGVSRTAVWKAIKQLVAQGVPVQHRVGEGYSLSFPYMPLDAEAIATLAFPDSVSPASVLVHNMLESSNGHLLEMARAGAAHGTIVVAEGQSGGRGRRGRSWSSPWGQNLYFSMLLRFDAPASALAPFTLVAGLVLAEVLAHLGATDHGIKWPNDILHEGRKLAGVLCELQGEFEGPCALVVGIGVNVHAETPNPAIDQPWTSLKAAFGLTLDRNLLAGLLARALLQAHQQFCEEGFAAFHARWERWDLLRNQPVKVLHPGRDEPGLALGVNESGQLRVDFGGATRIVHSGEVSIRLGT